GGEWDPIRTNIDAVSGALTLNLGSGKENLERRVAAKDLRDPEDKTPELTIKEAIKKAFDAEEVGGRLLYKDANGKDIVLDESAVNVVTDENTKKEIDAQLANMPDKKVYDVKWKRGMKMTLHVPEKYFDFEKSDTGFYYTYGESGGYTGSKRGRINAGGNGYSKENLQLKPYTSYTARAYVKSDSSNGLSDVIFYVDNNQGEGNGAKVNGKVNGQQWQQIEFSFNTGANPEYFSNIGFKNNGNAQLHFDEVSVTEWTETEDIQKAHVFDTFIAQYDIFSSNIEGIKFSKTSHTKVRYQLFLNNTWKEIRSDVLNEDGTIDLTKWNGGNGLPAHQSSFVLYAVDEKNDNLKVKVAERHPLAYDHGYQSWNQVGSYMNGIFFKAPDSKVRYQIAIDNQPTVILPGYPLNPQGVRYINFLEFNAGMGIPLNKQIRVFVVDEKNDNLREQIAFRSATL
ncbi:hypothetical protein IKC_06111, partial [Bacillus cereus VD184]